MIIKTSGNGIIYDGDYYKIYKPKTIIVNHIEEETAKKFIEDFQKCLDTGQNIIPIIIDSYGGDVYAAFSMADIIRTSPVPVMTICSGKACSAGALLLSCGHEGYRYATENSTIMLHDVASLMEGKIEDMKNSMKEMNRVNHQMYKLFDENCKKSPGFFKDKIKKLKNVDFWVDPQRALSYNIINYIGAPNLTYHINYGFNLIQQEINEEKQ